MLALSGVSTLSRWEKRAGALASDRPGCGAAGSSPESAQRWGLHDSVTGALLLGSPQEYPHPIWHFGRPVNPTSAGGLAVNFVKQSHPGAAPHLSGSLKHHAPAGFTTEMSWG